MGALANATGNPILRGMADGARAGAQAQNRQSATLRLADRQRELDAQRNERIARDAGASNADDVEAIAKSINQPPAGITGEQMTRAYRDIGPALRNRSQQLGGNARAAAAMGEGNFRSYGDLAAALATERARLNAGQTVEASAQPTAQPSQTTQQNTSTQTDGNPVSAATSTPAAIASQAKVAPSDLPGLRDPGGLPNGAPSAAANSTRSGSHSATPVTANQPNQNAATPQGTSTPTQPPASRPTPDTATLPTPTQTPSSPPTLDTSTPSAADWIATMRDAPMQHWAKHAPKATDPGSDGVTEHDWGVGLKLSHHTGADPARASLWGEMAADLRRTPEYGQRYVGELVSLVESHTMSERELMDVVDRRLNQDESAGNTPLRQVRRFWRASALPEENNTKR